MFPKWSIITEILKESLSLAVSGLKNNLLRTLLSMLAIIIGVLTIISILTFIDSLDKSVRDSVSKLGSDCIYIQRWPWATEGEFQWWKYINRPEPNMQEMQLLQKRLRNEQAIALSANIQGKNISNSDGSQELKNIFIEACSYDYNMVFDLDFAQGRYFTEPESFAASPKIILGAEIAEKLFPEGNPVGKHVKLFNRKFFVIGVLEKSGGGVVKINNYDKAAIITMSYAQYLFGTSLKNMEPTLMIKAKNGINPDVFEDEVRGMMRSIRRLAPGQEDNFALNRASFLNERLNVIFLSLSIAGWIIAAFSILVGGFGTANIMFVSVKERTFLIGIEKALGSPRYFILAQFLGEAIILCLIGGVIGLVLVTAIVMSVNLSQDDITLILTFKNIGIGIALSMVIGVLAGFIPALRASKLDPVEAIRNVF